MHFAYVMTATDREKMKQLGFTLLKEDKNNKVWVFTIPESLYFSADDRLSDAGIRYVLSDMLTF